MTYLPWHKYNNAKQGSNEKGEMKASQDLLYLNLQGDKQVHLDTAITGRMRSITSVFLNNITEHISTLAMNQAVRLENFLSMQSGKRQKPWGPSTCCSKVTSSQ